MGRLEEKQRQYNELMDARKGPRPSGLTGTVDPFTCSLERFLDEAEILERLAKSWKLSFCQAVIGAGTLSGGLYLAYDPATGIVKAVVHPERFDTTIAEPVLNFWSFQCLNGVRHAANLDVPFVILAELKDGLYSLNLDGHEEIHGWRRAVGQRIAKRREFENVTSLCDYFPTRCFKSLRRKAE